MVAVETTALVLWLAAQEGLVAVVMEHKMETLHQERLILAVGVAALEELLVMLQQERVAQEARA